MHSINKFPRESWSGAASGDSSQSFRFNFLYACQCWDQVVAPLRGDGFHQSTLWMTMIWTNEMTFKEQSLLLMSTKELKQSVIFVTKQCSSPYIPPTSNLMVTRTGKELKPSQYNQVPNSSINLLTEIGSRRNYPIRWARVGFALPFTNSHFVIPQKSKLFWYKGMFFQL